jgi:glyoxylase-like metal-dependent hydrolase (beta-lactamase superfamily II)
MLSGAAAIILLVSCSSTPNPKSALRHSLQTIGDVHSIQYSGSGVNGDFGQALASGAEWPRREVVRYSRTIDYDQKSSSEEIEFAQEVFGGKKQNAEVSGDKAWGVRANGPLPQPANAEERQLQIWMTPHGFVKGALAAADTKYDAAGSIVFTALGKYKIAGNINDPGYVTRVETTLANPVLGDTPETIVYSDYKEYSGATFPTKILQRQGGFPVWDLAINYVRANPPAALAVPDEVKNAPPPAVSVQSSKIADGVWFLGGGSHHSVLVEFKDYAAVIEAPLNEERSLAVLAEAKKLVPDKPVKYVISTHHHFDHAGGLRAYVAQGVTIVTHESNKEYFEKLFQRPATLAPDLLAKNSKAPVIETVSDKYALTDGKQTIEVYPVEGDNHTEELLVAYLPGPKILVEADSYSPAAENTPPPSTPPPNAATLYNNIQRLKLNVATIAPIHGRGPVPFAEFKRFVGKS